MKKLTLHSLVEAGRKTLNEGKLSLGRECEHSSHKLQGPEIEEEKWPRDAYSSWCSTEPKLQESFQHESNLRQLTVKVPTMEKPNNRASRESDTLAPRAPGLQLPARHQVHWPGSPCCVVPPVATRLKPCPVRSTPFTASPQRFTFLSALLTFSPTPSLALSNFSFASLL